MQLTRKNVGNGIHSNAGLIDMDSSDLCLALFDFSP